ncbi:MAG: TIGR00266 family protein [Candidatus Kapabacteria bacterium]|nr:TIGR00266 family protein [Candidatus Kapabacteria bacterium]
MNFQIDHAPVYSTLRVDMRQGEQFRAEAGAMISMSPTIELAATSSGRGIMGTLKAAVGGESIFASMYTAAYGDGEVVLAPATPGDIVQLDLRNETWFAQRGAYLAGDPALTLGTQGSIKALISGEGLFLSKIAGTGMLFLNSFGAIYHRDLAMGERYVVDTGHIVAFPSSVTYSIRKAASGLFSTLASGEGLVCEFMGPGRIYMQTRNVRALAGLLQPFLHTGS